MSKCLTIERSRSNEICKSKKINVRTFNNLWNIVRTNNGLRLSKLAKWESLTKRATTYWWTRRKHRVSSEWINNRMALVRSKYCQYTLPLPFDPLRLIFLSRRGSFVSINNVSLRVSLAKQTLLFSTRIRFHRFFFREVSYGRTEMGLRYNFMRYAPIVINGVHMKHLKTVDLHFSFALLEKKWISWKFI